MWYQLTVSSSMSGADLAALLRDTHSIVSFSDVVISSASGAGFNAPGVPEDVVRVAGCSYEACLAWLPRIAQFDWGDFFLTNDPSVQRLVGFTMEQLFAAAKASLVTVRALDSSDWDVLTTDERVISTVRAKYGGQLNESPVLETLRHLTG